MLALLAAFILSGCGLSMDRAEAVNAMNKGLEQLSLGQTLEAVSFLKEAASIDPTYADPPYYLGQIYHHKLNELNNAEINYREALSRDNENPQINYQLGNCLSDQNKWADSISFFKRATEIEPTFGKAFFRLGLAYEMEKSYPEAVEAYMASINAQARMKMDEDDKGGAAYHALGDLYNRFGFYDKALKVYENGLENNPGVPRLMIGRGVAQLKLERFAEAESSFKEALELDKSATTAIFNLAVAYMAQKKVDQAVEGFNNFVAVADHSRDEARIIAAQGFVQKIMEAKEAAEEKK